MSTDRASQNFDPVTKPAHYTEDREHETIDVIEDWNLDYHLGNVVKYISRAGRKGSLLEDLKKADFFLHRRLDIEYEREEERAKREWEG